MGKERMSIHRMPNRPPFVAGLIRRLSVPIVLGWLAVIAVVTFGVPSLEQVGRESSVSLVPQAAPSFQAMQRMGQVFGESNSDSVAMVVLEGDDVDLGRIDTQHLGRQSPAADEHRPGGRRASPARRDDLGPEQGVDQGALAGAGAAQRGHNQRGFEPHAQCGRPIGQPANQRPTSLGRFPGRRTLGPSLQAVGQGIDLRKQFDLG